MSEQPIRVLNGQQFDYFQRVSSETVSFLRPLARRAASTLRPFAVAILSRKPCLLIFFLCEGWKVRFIVLYFICFRSFGRAGMNLRTMYRASIGSTAAECKGKTFLVYPKTFALKSPKIVCCTSLPWNVDHLFGLKKGVGK